MAARFSSYHHHLYALEAYAADHAWQPIKDFRSLSALGKEYGDFAIIMEVWGSFKLNNDRVPLYYLKDGQLTKLKEVAFDNIETRYGVVTFFENRSGSWTARWLIVDDMSKASTLEYLST